MIKKRFIGFLAVALASTALLSACSDSESASDQQTQPKLNNEGRLIVSNQPNPGQQNSSQQSPESNSQFSNAIPAAPTIDVNAAAWALLDYETGEVLSQKNMHKSRKPASLTKIMTAYIVAQALKDGSIKLDERVPISRKAWKTGGSKMFVKPDDVVTVEQLLKGMIVQSGNDATVALAEFLAGSEKSFTILMNQTAQGLGMKNSHFTNSDGLPSPEQVTTAYDMAILARAFIHNFPETYKLYSQKSYTWSGIKQYNRNKLLDFNPHVDGMKTGHTKLAGYNLVASAKKDGERLISVIMGAPSAQTRVQESNKLLTYGYRFFETVNVLPAGAKVENIKVTGAKNPNEMITLSSKKAIRLTLPKSQISHLNKELVIEPKPKAPIKKGQQVGKIQVTLGDKALASVPLYSEQNVSKAGFFTRITNTIKGWF